MNPVSKDPLKTRKLILSTALRLFTERGYFATSTHDLKRASGLSVGSIYHHFDSKESLARAIYEDLFTRMTTVIEDAVASESTSKGKSWAVVGALFTLAVKDPETLQFILNARHREFLPEAPPICSTKPFELMRSIMEYGIANGEIREMDPLVASAVIFGGAIRLIHLALDGLLPMSIELYLDSFMDAAWLGVAA